MERAGITAVMPEDAEVLLVTVSSQQGLTDMRRALRAIGNRRALVLAGGGGCWAPAVFDPYISAACVGEGARFMRTLFAEGKDAALALPETWIPGEIRTVVPNTDFPWELPPLNHPDGTVRLFGSRGCAHRCLFCQTGWETNYRVNPNPERLQQQARRMIGQGRRVALITNDGGEEHVRIPCQQEFLSMRLDGLRRMEPITRAITKGIRIGVEGVSERLRVAVGKPVDNETLLRVSSNALKNGVGVRWFFIVGLPGETDNDYEELRALVAGVKRFPKGAVMMNFHSYIPQPATPLCVFPLRDTYWEPFNEFRRWFFDGPGFTRRVQIIAPAKYAGRLARARESMAASEDELRRGWFAHDNVNWRVGYPASPTKLREVARKYADHLGMAVQFDQNRPGRARL